MAQDSQIGVYRPGIREQELFFRNFYGLTPDFIKLLVRRPFFFFFFFFCVFTLEFVENCKNFETTTRICENFCTEDLFFGLHFFRLLLTRINFSCPRAPLEFTLINFSSPPKFISAPPPSYAILPPCLLLLLAQSTE